MASRLVLYGALSTLGAASVVGSALHTRANFYAAAVAVGRSSGALMVLANFALFNTICFGIVVKTIFFGRLRSIEYEHLFERLWLFLTESLLALTIFRDDFSAPFAVMYGVLLFLKCFHWITADRVDYMDQIPPPGPPTIFHVRCSLIIGLLTLIDCALVIYSLESIVVDGVSAMVLFASEFMILLASIGGTSARYTVGIIDLRRARGREDAPSWEEKSMYLFYVDLGVDFVKLLTYLTFFLVILLNYGLPLHILRDVYMTLRSFLSRCSDLVRYRRATRDMDSLYPNATNEDLTRNGDRTCIICREEMVPYQSPAERAAAAAAASAAGEVPAEAEAGGPNETPKRLQCGHIFHFHCLRSWLERQQSCPTCRRDVLRTPVAPRPGPRAGQNGVNVQINPPPPAAGAVPRLNAVPGAPNPIQAVYDQYFRPPQPPTPAHPAPTAVPGPTTATSSNAPLPSPQISRDQQIQRGIWGGPIAPGRFFATPLGAAPAWPPSGASASASGSGSGPSRYDPTMRMPIPVPATRSQGASMPIIRLPEPSSASGSSSNTATPPPSGPSTSATSETAVPRPRIERDRPTFDIGPSASGAVTPHLASGANTPHTSNPPQIFSASGSGSGSASGAGEYGHVGLEGVGEGDEGKEMAGAASMSASASEEEGGGRGARRAAAEAALRRMGLRSGTAAAARLTPTTNTFTERPAMTVLEKPAEEEELREDSSEDSEEGGSTRALDRKGEGKGKATDTDPTDELDVSGETPRFTPYLTRPGSDLLSASPRGHRWAGTGGQDSIRSRGRMTIQGTRDALEERLKVMREVDEVVWGLVGDLSRLKSDWEEEGGVHGRV